MKTRNRRRSIAKPGEAAIKPTGAEHNETIDKNSQQLQKVKQLQELFADAPQVGKTALENALRELKSQASETLPPPVESAGRVGSRLGKVSELTIIVPLVPS